MDKTSEIQQIGSPHHHIKDHHQHKTDGKANSAEIAMLSAGGFWYQLFYYDVEHGSCCKSKHIGESRS